MLNNRWLVVLTGGCLVVLLVTLGRWSVYPPTASLSAAQGGASLRERDDTITLAAAGAGALAPVRLDRAQSQVSELETRLDRTLESLERAETLSRTILNRMQSQNMSHSRPGVHSSFGEPLGEHGEIDTNQLLHQLHKLISQRIHKEEGLPPAAAEEGGDSADEEAGSADDDRDQFYDLGQPMRPGQIRITRNMDCVDGYDPERLIVYFCNRKQPKQIWKYTAHQQIQTSENWCIDATGVEKGGILRVQPCDDKAKGQKFDFLPAKEYAWNLTGSVQLVGTSLCLTAPSPFGDDVASVRLHECGQHRCLQAMHFNALFHDTPRTVTEVAISKKQPKARPMYNYETMNGKGGKIFCWIMTNPKNHDTKAVTVRDTWARHCDKLVFVTTKRHPGLDVWIARLDQEESRDMLWAKSKQAWIRAYRRELNGYDWFIRGDDDTFMMMDNLREFLDDKSPEDLHYFGRYFLGHFNEKRVPFYSGGSGTILSRGALRKLGRAVSQGKPIFNDWNTFADDMELGISMKRIGVPAVESLDAEGRNLFIALGLDAERSARKSDDPNNWYWKYCPTAKEGKECCSTRWLGTHYVTPDEMRSLEDLHLMGCEAAGNDME
ncbi:hypothetical protein PTSG_05763 [Salpingoeca rosetta]|uniref:N-acetylgalactosaminide beta-1,3-galactosyltransferase n=1 Tax=Salpingoeca rosetta (strain ATCC 50818 / BSB-021) TaxID=946362 RepID=F2UB58_SALR5|nr:uncharacterized protein PTSG_05763 [Salpingoeca rosetta]EGD74071.1 hypothetical protein PTSG_05763 [Salpingoeca rosetta]|eukprot:XP_004993633.1 hypothetical protein PTSG_05763 [Salpingoeca rosetta]